MSKELSETMKAVRDKAIAEGRWCLVRRPGGFWTLPDAKHDGRSWGWFAGTSTIEALVSRGVAKYTAFQNRKRDGEPFPVEVTMETD